MKFLKSTVMITKIVFVAGSGNVFATNVEQISPTFSMVCNDRTFAYNKLEVKVVDGNVNFKSSGQNLGIYRAILPAGTKSFETSVSFTIEGSKCLQSKEDAKILTCRRESLVLDVETRNSVSTQQKTQVSLKAPYVRLRKIQEVGIFNNDVVVNGYELEIEDRRTTILTQKYHYATEADNTQRCHILNP